MATAPGIRILRLAAMVTLLFIGSPTSMAPAVMTPLEELATRVADDDAPRTPEEQALADFAISRFAEQGLELPQVHIEFHPTTFDCGGREGLYVHDTRSLHMCSRSLRTMLHELAHAWARHNLTDEEREAFTALRGLDSWNGKDEEWEDRATEHAAEIIAWALLDNPNHVRWVGEDGVVEYRLLSIDNSDPDSMLTAFQALTGLDSIYRNATEWSDETTAPVPGQTVRTTGA